MDKIKTNILQTFLFLPICSILFCFLFLIFFWNHIFLSFLCLMVMYLCFGGTLIAAVIGLFRRDKPKHFVNIGTLLLALILVVILNTAWKPSVRGKIQKVIDVNLVHFGVETFDYHPATFGYGGKRGHEDVIFSPHFADIAPGYLYSEDDWPDASVSLHLITDLEPIAGNWYRITLEYY